jgi:NAD(P)-dependent dehydrogenase (short-subunit alcohol dehydrogenase family)
MGNDRFDLHGRVAIVTGSTKGMGLAIARRFVASGARVVVSSRNAQECAAVAAELNAQHGDEVAIGVRCEIEIHAQLEQLVDAALSRWGRLTTLVCNASARPWYGPSLETPEEALDFQFLSVFKSKFWLTRLAIPRMVEAGGGSIVFISSGSVHEATSERSVYACMRAAEIQLVKNIAAEFGDRRIRANAIFPGLIETESSRPLFDDPEKLRSLVQRHPLRRAGEAAEIASAVAFLASDLSAFTTGWALPVDGGRIIHAVQHGLTEVLVPSRGPQQTAPLAGQGK